ncbi:hypothetical protein HOC37_04875 [bacterium]|jgi:hypothetical protein|nr:hypothetical protein [bacterium]MBT3581878.1 hypothetical protein [bacterium]MBT4552295.1 hypothetical protein [bacterium]MBT5989158.1 hypothetical protein [bacterium]
MENKGYNIFDVRLATKHREKNMKLEKISDYVNQYLEKQPFIEEAMRKKIINYANLAQLIKPELEKELAKKAAPAAIVMALRRYAQKTGRATKTFPQVHFEEDTDIRMRSDLLEITLIKSEEMQNEIKKTYKLIDFKKEDFITLVYGLHEISMITNQKYEQRLLKVFADHKIKFILKNLSSLTINIPDDSYESVGLFYLFTRALAWENIQIVEIISTFKEMSFILNTPDIPQAFAAIKKVINEYRK